MRVRSLLPLLLLPTLVGCGDKAPSEPAPDDTEDTDETPDPGDTGTPLDADGDGFPADEDCDDTDPDVTTGALWFIDADGDGFGDAATGRRACEAPAGRIADGTDCNDADPAVHPGAAEVCNGVDDDCDAATSEDGTVAAVGPDGAVRDITDRLSTDPSQPTTLGSDTEGTLRFCRGTHHVNLVLAHDFAVEGIGGAVLDGGAAGSVVSLQGEGLAVQLSDITLQNGSSASGGGLSCTAGTGRTPSTVVANGVTLAANEAGEGGGAYLSNCILEMQDGTIRDNEATSTDGGGVLLVEGARAALSDSLVQDNATAGGGGGIAALGADAALTGTRVVGNMAMKTGGGAHLSDGASLVCTGSAASPAGFTGNEAAGPGGGITLDDGATGARLDVAGCDFGTPEGGDDNSDHDVVVVDLTSAELPVAAYAAGDAATFSCAEGTCGTPTTHTPTSPHRTVANETHGSELLGNVFEVDGTPTLDAYTMAFRPDARCPVEMHVYSSSDAGTTWTPVWSAEVWADPTRGAVSSPHIGLPLEAGALVALSIVLTPEDCGGRIEVGAFEATPGADLGVGRWRGLAHAQTPDRFDAAADAIAYEAGFEVLWGTRISITEL